MIGKNHVGTAALGKNHVGTAALGRPVERSSTDGADSPLVRALPVTCHLRNSSLE